MRTLRIFVAVAVLAFSCGSLYAQVNSLRSATLLTSSIGWCASNTHLFWTSDRGNTWLDITPQDAAGKRIASVFFLDITHGWILLSSDNDAGEPTFVLAATSDAGHTWSLFPVAMPETSKYEAPVVGGGGLEFTDALHGWMTVTQLSSAAFRLGFILQTRDGGKTWQRAASTPGSQGPGIAGIVHFVTLKDGFLAGGPGDRELYVTHDGAKSWRRIDLRPPSGVNANAVAQYDTPIFSADRVGYLPVTYSEPSAPTATLVLFKTSDGGTTWRADRYKLNAGSAYGPVVPIAMAGDNLITAEMDRNDGKRLTLSIQGSSGVTTRASASYQVQSIRQLRFVSTGTGWLLTERSLLATTDGGQSWKDITPTPTSDRRLLMGEVGTVYGQSAGRPIPTAGVTWYRRQNKRRPLPAAATAPANLSSPSAKAMMVTPNLISTHLGFDRCNVPPVTTMNTWWSESPYYDIGVYIGGDTWGCRNHPNLNNDWIIAVLSQGWGIMQIWSGPQAPCTAFSLKIPANDPDAARAAGEQEANKAIAKASTSGMANKIIYYDMESYNAADQDCANSVNAFISGWIAGLWAGQYPAGVYSCASCAASWYSSTFTPSLPDAIWIAKYDHRATVWGLGYGLTDDMFSNGRRSHQFWGFQGDTTYYETWGGQTLDIDIDIDNGSTCICGDGEKFPSYDFSTLYGVGLGLGIDVNGIGNIRNQSDQAQLVGDWIDGSYNFHGWFSTDGPVTSFDYPGAAGTIGEGINWNGTVSGSFYIDQLYNLSAFLYSNASFTVFGDSLRAYGINDDKQVVGFKSDETGFVMTDLTAEPFQFPGAVATYAAGINGSGTVAGSYYDQSWNSHGFVYYYAYPDNAGPLLSIDLTGADEVEVNGINNNDQVVGWYESSIDYSWHGFIYDLRHGTARTVDVPWAPGPYGYTVALGINDAGQIVGYYVACDTAGNCGNAENFIAKAL